MSSAACRVSIPSPAPAARRSSSSSNGVRIWMTCRWRSGKRYNACTCRERLRPRSFCASIQALTPSCAWRSQDRATSAPCATWPNEGSSRPLKPAPGSPQPRWRAASKRKSRSRWTRKDWPPGGLRSKPFRQSSGSPISTSPGAPCAATRDTTSCVRSTNSKISMRSATWS